MIIENSVLISIVIPIYNGAFFLEETINSLLSQTFPYFELICVNDSSTDNSLQILDNFAKKDNRIKVYTKPNGGTAAKAIVHGLKFASGNYFMYASQDDLFSTDLLEKNFNKAKELNADAIVPDMIFYDGTENADKGIIGVNGNRNLILTGRESFVLSLDWVIHGFTLWSMELVRKVGFYDFAINSDEYTTRMLYFNSNIVAFSDAKFYYRQNNPNAITKKWNITILESFDTCIRLDEFLVKNHFSKSEMLCLSTTILAELLRIQRIFLLNEKQLEKSDAIDIQRKIKNFYNRYSIRIKAVKSKSLLQQLKLKIITANFSFIVCYCKVAILYNNLKAKSR